MSSKSSSAEGVTAAAGTAHLHEPRTTTNLPPFTLSTIEHDHGSAQSLHQPGEHRGHLSGLMLEFDGLVLWPEFESADPIGRGGNFGTLRPTLAESLSPLLRRAPVRTLGQQQYDVGGRS